MSDEIFLGMPRPELVPLDHAKVGNATRGGLVCARLTPLLSRRSRFRQAGWRRWRDGEALLLSPAEAVHSFGARGGLRAHFLDAEWRVLASVLVPPRRARPSPHGCAAALLMAPDSPAIPVGDRLELLRSQPRSAPGRE